MSWSASSSFCSEECALNMRNHLNSRDAVCDMSCQSCRSCGKLLAWPGLHVPCNILNEHP